MSDVLRKALEACPNITVYYRYDNKKIKFFEACGEQLDSNELVNKDAGRQQVATLMIKMTGIKNTGESDMSFTSDKNGSMCCWGGNVTNR